MAAPNVNRITAHAVTDGLTETSAGAYYRLHASMLARTAVRRVSRSDPTDHSYYEFRNCETA